jgi:hypothetical protein
MKGVFLVMILAALGACSKEPEMHWVGDGLYAKRVSIDGVIAKVNVYRETNMNLPTQYTVDCSQKRILGLAENLQFTDVPIRIKLTACLD